MPAAARSYGNSSTADVKVFCPESVTSPTRQRLCVPLPATSPPRDVQREVDARTGELWHAVRVLHDVAERPADPRLVRLGR